MMHIDEMAGERDVQADLVMGYRFPTAPGIACAKATVGSSRIAGDR
jgi:hypothetical protein